jgi:hypothetical protein
MRNYEERAKDFVKMLFPLIDDCEDVWDFRKAVEMFNRLYTRKVRLNHGIARVAFITSDYVVKLEYDSYEVNCVGGGENEIKMYAIAEQEGFAYLFAKVVPYDYNGKRFYIMPRIHGVGRYRYDYADEHMTDEENDFCCRHAIGDLHGNNYGFRNGHVCIIDYACREYTDTSSSSTSSRKSWS